MGNIQINAEKITVNVEEKNIHEFVNFLFDFAVFLKSKNINVTFEISDGLILKNSQIDSMLFDYLCGINMEYRAFRTNKIDEEEYLMTIMELSRNYIYRYGKGNTSQAMVDFLEKTFVPCFVPRHEKAIKRFKQYISK